MKRKVTYSGKTCVTIPYSNADCNICNINSCCQVWKRDTSITNLMDIKKTHKIEEYCCNFCCFCVVLIPVVLKGMILGIMSIIDAINIIALIGIIGIGDLNVG